MVNFFVHYQKGTRFFFGGRHVLTINVRICFRSKQWNLDFSFQSFCLLRRKKDFHSIVAAIHLQLKFLQIFFTPFVVSLPRGLVSSQSLIALRLTPFYFRLSTYNFKTLLLRAWKASSIKSQRAASSPLT